MLLDRTHRKWLSGSSAALALLLAAFVICRRSIPGGMSGGSVPGLLFGIAGTAMMVFAALLGARRKGRTWPFRKAQTWMRGHLWIGLLSVPTVLFHANLQAGGFLEQLLWWCLGFVILSGLFGLIMQQILPRTMATSLAAEISTTRQPVSRVMLAVEAEAEIAGLCGPFRVTPEPQAHEINVSDPIIESLKTSFVEGEKGSKWYDSLSGTKRDHAISIMRFVTDEWEPKPAELEKIYTGLKNGSPGSQSAAGPLKSPSGRTTASLKGQAATAESAGRLSPLEQLKQKQAAATAKGGTSASPLEQLKQKQAAANTAKASTSTSPLEQLKQKQAAANAAKGSTSASPLELLKQQAGAKKSAAESSLSPLAQLKRKAAATGSQTAGISDVAGRPGGSDQAHLASSTPAGTSQSLLEDLRLLIRNCARTLAQDTLQNRPAEKVCVISPHKEKLQTFYLTRIRPYLLAETGFRPVGRRSPEQSENLNDVHLANRLFDSMNAELSTDCEPVLNCLQEIVTKCRDLNRQVRLHWWLHAWLAIHIPTTVVLFVLIFAHAVMALRVIPVSL